MIVDYIDSQRESHGVEPICSVLAEAGVPIASSTYYAHKATPVSAAMLEEAHLVNSLVTLWHANWGVYGWRVRGSRGRSARWGRGGSGRRIGRCGRRCVRRVGLSRRGLCSGSSGV